MIPTIGIQRYYFSYMLNDNSYISLKIIDTSGREKFRNANSNLYNEADCIILLYDITDRCSFNECQSYYSEKIKTLLKKNAFVLLVGNKSDLTEKRMVSFKEGKAFASQYKFIFMETSCHEKENAFKIFEKIIALNAQNIKMNEKKSKK